MPTEVACGCRRPWNIGLWKTTEVEGGERWAPGRQPFHRISDHQGQPWAPAVEQAKEWRIGKIEMCYMCGGARRFQRVAQIPEKGSSIFCGCLTVKQSLGKELGEYCTQN